MNSNLLFLSVAELNPYVTVVGTDLSPIQPDLVPQNLFFEIRDAEDDWPRDLYSHVRMSDTVQFFRDRPGVFRQAYQ